jgi:hypothetical protein
LRLFVVSEKMRNDERMGTPWVIYSSHAIPTLHSLRRNSGL